MRPDPKRGKNLGMFPVAEQGLMNGDLGKNELSRISVLEESESNMKGSFRNFRENST